MVIFRPFIQHKILNHKWIKKNDKSHSMLQNTTCMKQNSTKKKSESNWSTKVKLSVETQIKKETYVNSRENKNTVIWRIMPRLGAKANHELHSKNGEECNLSVSAHLAQCNPSLLVTLCSVQTASSLLWATPKISVQHRIKLPTIWISTPSTEHLIPTVTL
jgi:hypothetical protein